MVMMFNGCCALTSIDVSKFNTQNVIDMRYMFHYYSKLKSIDVCNFNIEKLKEWKIYFIILSN